MIPRRLHRYASTADYDHAFPDRAFPAPDGWDGFYSLYQQHIDVPGRPGQLNLDFLPGGMRGPADQKGHLVVSDPSATGEVIVLNHTLTRRRALDALIDAPRRPSTIDGIFNALDAADTSPASSSPTPPPPEGDQDQGEDAS